MTPGQFEHAIADHLQRQGYRTQVTPMTNDYGVDVFATRGSEKLAVQCKMYGGTRRRVNRATVLELYGAAAFFDCTGSVIATNGQMMPDARAAADKLGVRILFADAGVLTPGGGSTHAQSGWDFASIWEGYVLPLAGHSLERPDGKTNVVVSVDWSGVHRITSTGGRQFIKIEIFEWAVNRILSRGWVEREEVNQEYVGRASRGIILILSEIPLFRLVGTERLELKEMA
jgi:hypothetical protein